MKVRFIGNPLDGKEITHDIRQHVKAPGSFARGISIQALAQTKGGHEHAKRLGKQLVKDNNQVCSMFGVDFIRNQVVDVSHLSEREKKKLADNLHFEVVPEEKAKPKTTTTSKTE